MGRPVAFNSGVGRGRTRVLIRIVEPGVHDFNAGHDGSEAEVGHVNCFVAKIIGKETE